LKFTYLTRKDILEIHRRVIRDSGDNPVIVFTGNLDMCAESPKLEMYGLEIHKTVYEKAASLLYAILKLHPFLDGNKRTGFEAADVFLRLNGYVLAVDKADAVETCLKIAECSMEMDETSTWVKSRLKRR
jgi:death-on-curing protein